MAFNTFTPPQIPGIPVAVQNLIQQNMLSRDLRDGLRPYSWFRMEANRKQLPPHTGETVTYSKLGMFDVNLTPASPLGDPTPLAAFTSEQYVAHPIPFANSFQIDGPTAYVQAGSYIEQNMKRLSEWAGRTSCRIVRGRLFNYAGGQSIVRTAATTANSTLVVNSLAGFRSAPVNGTLTPVSSTNTLSITIVAATTFTALVTGVTPLNSNFPDGPGTLTLSTTLSANVAAQSYIVAATAPFQLFANGKASTEALLKTDFPKIKDIYTMTAKLGDLGVPPHEDGSYHLHVDNSFRTAIQQDSQWQIATQGQGPSAAFGPGSLEVPGLGIVVLVSNDLPAVGRGKEVAVGGTPGSSVSMQDLGLDVVNSTGVPIRRAIMTGRDALIETYVNQEDYFTIMGIEKVGPVTSNLNMYEMNGNRFIAGEVDGWMLSIRPALDARGIVTTVTASSVFDYTLETDYFAATQTTNQTPLKRAVTLAYGNGS